MAPLCPGATHPDPADLGLSRSTPLGGTQTGEPPADGFTHTLLVRKSTEPTTKAGRTSYEFAYFLVHDRADTPVPDMIAGAGLRWKIEEGNENGKDALGLDEYQVRKWTPFYRHVTLVMLVMAFLTTARADLGKEHGPPERAR